MSGFSVFPLDGIPELREGDDLAAMIVERVKAGLARARSQGKRLGRPSTDAKTEKSIRKALAAGDKGMLKIAAQFGVGSGTVQRIKAAMTADAHS